MLKWDGIILWFIVERRVGNQKHGWISGSLQIYAALGANIIDLIAFLIKINHINSTDSNIVDCELCLPRQLDVRKIPL